ncbi:MAG TPA: HEAT repeat domain-containing protein [Sedimentisphaerales bacterium]|nr:HEAT repeat domain-containing protein [Sedimentisphaerales bacterium]
MSRSRTHFMLMAAILLGWAGQIFAQTVAAKADEPKLIATVKDAGAPLKARIDACRQLGIIGGKDSIGPLAALLGDEQLSHNARYALQVNPDPAVDEALRNALGTVKGKPLVGVIHTVGYRRDAKAVGTLASLVTSGSPVVAGAAARALGDIGNAEAAQALEQARSKVPAECRLDVYEGLLRCAESLAFEGSRPAALEIYDRLYKLDAPHQVRGGALRGAILTRQAANRQKLLKEHLGNEDYILFSAAVEASHQMRSARATTILTDALKGLSADRQILVIHALGVRGERGAIPSLLQAAGTGDPRVRIAALQVVTELGDPAAVPVLARLLDDGNREVAKAAQESLATFPGQEADAVVMEMFADANRDKQRVALELMGRRRITSGIPALVQAADDTDLGVRTGAIRMIGELGSLDQLPVLLGLLQKAGQSQELTTVEQAITAICLRATDSRAQTDRLMIGHLDKAASVQKASLIRVLGAVGGPDALQAVSACARGDDVEVRSAAVRALGTWRTLDAAPTLIAMAKETGNLTERTLLLRGYLSLAGRGDVPIADRVAMCREAAGMVARDEEKRLLLGTLSNVDSPEAVEMITPYLDEAATRQEAALAAVAVSERLLRGSGPAPFAGRLIAPLEKAVQVAGSESLAKRANTVLEQARTKAAAR